MTLKLVLALTYDSVLLVICTYALLRGGRPERLGAAVNIGGSLATIALRWLTVATGAPAEIVILTVDAGVVGGFFWLAISTNRFWPIWAFGFAVANVVMSLSGALLPESTLFAYHTGLGIYAYLALAALAIGTYRLPLNATPDQRRGHRPPWTTPTQT